MVQRASLQVAEGALYDPYKILGIAAVRSLPVARRRGSVADPGRPTQGATEKQIKSFFKKAAIK